MKNLTIILIIVLIVIVGFFTLNNKKDDLTEKDQAESLVENSEEEKNNSNEDSIELDESDLIRLSDISLVDLQGRPVSLSDFKGKPLVLNSWAVWCPFCRKELPDFALLQEEFEEDITVIAIDRAESKNKIESYLNGLGLLNSMIFLIDEKDDFYKKIGGFSMPETLFIDKNGKINFHKRGVISLEDMRNEIFKIIN